MIITLCVCLIVWYPIPRGVHQRSYHSMNHMIAYTIIWHTLSYTIEIELSCLCCSFVNQSVIPTHLLVGPLQSQRAFWCFWDGEVLLRRVGTLLYLLILREKYACQVPICAVAAWWFDNPRQRVVPRSRNLRRTSHLSDSEIAISSEVPFCQIPGSRIS